jgi:uncharacterized protein YbjT (DUF2867 family)
MSDRVLVIGGTGAMGSPVVRALLATSKSAVRILTRDPDNQRVRNLRATGGGRVEAVRGNLDDEDSLSAAMAGARAVFCNTDFWSTASPLREYEQGLRALKAARAAGVDHFVWSSLDNAIGLTGGRVPVPHFDSKAAVEAWIDLMRSDEFMRQDADGWFSRHVSVLVTAPYFQNFQFRVLPKRGKLSDGRDGLAFHLPLGVGRYPLIALEDIAWFACHILANPDRWAGRTLRVLGDALSGADVAATFERVTGIPAEYRDVPLATIRAGMPGTGHDIAAMYQFFQEFDVKDRARDLGRLRKLHPGLKDFVGWLKASGWRGEPIAVQKMAVQLVV